MVTEVRNETRAVVREVQNFIGGAWQSVTTQETEAVYNPATGEVVVASSELRFRGLAELTDSLTNAGFTVEHVYGDWDRGPVTSASRVMVFIARRN